MTPSITSSVSLIFDMEFQIGILVSIVLVTIIAFRYCCLGNNIEIDEDEEIVVPPSFTVPSTPDVYSHFDEV